MDAAYWDELEAPWGRIVISVDELDRLCAVDVRGRRPQAGRDRAHCALPRQQLLEYFAGDRRTFCLSLRLDGTPFQQRVWQGLSEIPYASVLSYGELAARIGQPRAARAVGRANGANPVPIVIPCHRVIASGSRLGGYTGGLDVKQALLSLEGLELAA